MSTASPSPDATEYPQRRARLLRLVSMGCDAQLADSDAAELEQLVGSDPRLLRDYAEAVTTESLLQQTCGLSPLAPTAGTHQGANEGDSAGPAQSVEASPHFTVPHDTAKSRSPSRSAGKSLAHGRAAQPLRSRRSWTLGWLSLAACVTLVATIAALFAGGPVARIVSSADAWLADGEAPSVGASVGRSWVELDSGVLELAFADGAMMSVVGPAKVRALAGGVAEMAHGAAHFYVPPSAEGFVVRAPGGDIVDLGTSFRVAIGDDRNSSVHVTTGRVRMDSKLGSATELKAGQRATMTATGEVEALPPANVSVSGRFELVTEHPLSLGYNAFDRDGVARVFLERSDLRLGHEVRLDVADSGRHTQLEGSSTVVPEGAAVDVYLVHCAPASMRHEVRGAIRFPSKIIGVICGSDRLNATNTELGTRWTLQCGHPERGMESAPDPNSDVITISPDRRTLTAHFRTMSIDQMRILVAAE